MQRYYLFGSIDWPLHIPQSISRMFTTFSAHSLRLPLTHYVASSCGVLLLANGSYSASLQPNSSVISHYLFQSVLVRWLGREVRDTLNPVLHQQEANILTCYSTIF